MSRSRSTHGFALVSVLLLLAVLMAMVTAYFFLTRIETATTTSSASNTAGFYAAEAGLNLRGEEIRGTFQGFNRPAGRSLSAATGCSAPGAYTPVGTTDKFFCKDVLVGGRKVVSYVVEDPKNLSPNDADKMITILPPEEFAGLNAIEYRYEVMADSLAPLDPDERPETQLGMVFRSRLVPLFQFAAFYNKDLEISPGEAMTLNGRVHVNGDLYLNAGTGKTLGITGAVTVSERREGGGGGLYRRRKNNSLCEGTVRVNDAKFPHIPANEPAVACSGLVPQTTLDAWNGQILTGLDTITTPEVEAFHVGGEGWNKADLRIALDLRSPGAPRIIVPNLAVTAGNPLTATRNSLLTAQFNTCRSAAGVSKPYTPITPGAGVAEGSSSFRDTREGRVGGTSVSGDPPSKAITMLELDIGGVLTCLHSRKSFLFNDSPSTEKDISDTSQAGLVLFVTVIGPNSASPSSLYGVRIRNGEQLKAAAGPDIKGLTIVSDQAVYVQGHYNRDDPGFVWKPASFLVDSLNILSEAVDGAASWDANNSGRALGSRVAADTRFNAALLAGTTTTGNAEGVTGQNGLYNGGLENFPRFHENWDGKTLTYKGSFVSLSTPARSNSAWPDTGVIYKPPVRNWSYDERFNNPDNLPPLAPRFVYLRQERFARDFER